MWKKSASMNFCNGYKSKKNCSAIFGRFFSLWLFPSPAFTGSLEVKDTIGREKLCWSPLRTDKNPNIFRWFCWFQRRADRHRVPAWDAHVSVFWRNKRMWPTCNCFCDIGSLAGSRSAENRFGLSESLLQRFNLPLWGRTAGRHKAHEVQLRLIAAGPDLTQGGWCWTVALCFHYRFFFLSF